MDPVTRTARKPHPCDAGRNCTIQPGDRYVEQVWPPWSQVRDDPDTTSDLGAWVTQRSHSRCLARQMYE